MSGQEAVETGRAAGAAADEGPLVEAVRGREAFLRLRRDWNDALGRGPDASPAMEHDFLRMWIESFAPSSAPTVLVARTRGRIAAAVGILGSPGLEDGVPVRMARAWANAHSTRGGFMLGAPETEASAAIDALVRGLCEEPWDVLVLRDVPRERDTLETAARSMRRAGLVVLVGEPMDSPYIPLPSSREELDRRLDARFRQNLRRRRRRLEEHGRVSLEIVTGGDALDAALEDAFDIEAAGWKGSGGTAIRSRPDTLAFYTAWARMLARDGRLRLAFLALDGRRIAFQYALVAGGRWMLPKTGYLPSFAECSPGQLLMSEVLGRCVEERLETFEFLGHSMPWKRDWTPLVRPHATLRAYRPGVRGRLAWAARARLRPAVQLTLDRARRAAARMRQVASGVAR